MEDAKEEIDSIVSAAKAGLCITRKWFFRNKGEFRIISLAGKVAEVKWFLECGENVNATAGSTKRTALHEAAMNGLSYCLSLVQ